MVRRRMRAEKVGNGGFVGFVVISESSWTIVRGQLRTRELWRVLLGFQWLRFAHFYFAGDGGARWCAGAMSTNGNARGKSE
jgi:hypothetical protein